MAGAIIVSGLQQAATFFIAGTDTGVGKTRVTVALLAAARAERMAVRGMKPVAAGAELHDGRMISTDAVNIAAITRQSTPYEELNPYCLLEPISPHIAADRAKIAIDKYLIAEIAGKLGQGCDLLLIEGAGGWYTPISERESMADVARVLGCPVILVVGLRLGCLNHARLTLEAIAASDCHLAGWISNQIDPCFAAIAENLATLELLLGSKSLAHLSYAPDTADDAQQLRAALPRLRVSRINQNA